MITTRLTCLGDLVYFPANISSQMNAVSKFLKDTRFMPLSKYY